MKLLKTNDRDSLGLGRAMLLGGVLIVAVVLAAPAFVAAHALSDRFIDVPNTSPFHDNITNIARAGITRGCNPPANDRYCPSQSVPREQMAAFLNRGLGRAARGQFNVPVPTVLARVGGTSILVPGNGFILVNVHAGLTLIGSGSGSSTVAMRTSDPQTGAYSVYSNDSIGDVHPHGAMSVTWLFTVSGISAPTSYDINVDVELFTGSRTIAVQGAVTALWVPFGGDGSGVFATSKQGLPTQRRAPSP